MAKLYTVILATAVMAMTVGCASTGETRSSASKDNSVIKVDNTSIPLSDYLRRVPGVNVYGSGDNVKVNIRGTMSFETTTEPLYVIDGRRVGRNYSQVASIVPVAEIATVRVVKGVEASSKYGLEGGNGAIEITTKKR